MDSIIDDYDHINPHLLYTPTSIPGKGCDLNIFETQISTNCVCQTCQNTTCSCIRQNGPNYENNLLLDSKLSPDGSVIECNTQCQCTRCPNRVIQLGPHPNLKIIQAGLKGYGLICKYPLQKGQYICEYAGEVISRDEAAIRRESDNNNYIFVLNEYANDTLIETIVDATCIANIGRYINHSCDPNSIIVPVRVDSLVPKLAIFAKRPIDADEEITYSYDGSNIKSPNDGKPCLCGAKNCAKYLPCYV